MVVVVVGPRRSFVLDRAGEVAVTSPMFLRHRTPPAPSDRSAMCSLFDKWVWPPLPLSPSAEMPPQATNSHTVPSGWAHMGLLGAVPPSF